MNTPLTSTTALLCLALLFAGCGGSSSPGVAHVGTTSAASGSGGSGGSGGGAPESTETSAATQQKMVKFAQCMRTHGVPEFPEPVDGRVEFHGTPGNGLNPGSAQFQAAEKACRKYAPPRSAPSPAQRAKIEEQALKFSACMRHHGLPNFPDPQFSNGGGAVRLKVGKSNGIEPGSPQFQAAQKACQSNLPFKAPPGAHAGGAGGPKNGSSQSSGAVAAP